MYNINSYGHRPPGMGIANSPFIRWNRAPAWLWNEPGTAASSTSLPKIAANSQKSGFKSLFVNPGPQPVY